MSTLMMRIAGLNGYREFVRELGHDPEPLVQSAELHINWFDEPDHLIPAWNGCKLLEISAERLDCPTFGLQLAQRQGLSMLGPLGLMLQHSDTLESALEDLQKFLHVHSQAGNLQSTTSGNLLHITYAPLVSYQGSAKQLIDLTLAVGFSIISSLSNKSVSLISAYFTYTAPIEAPSYRKFFNCPVLFGAAENGVTVSKNVLAGSLASNQQSIRGFLNTYLQDKEAALRPTIDENLRILVRQLLPLGKCRLDIVSSALGVDKRTLQRRLKEVNTTFQTLIDQERQKIAVKYLKESDLGIAQISDLLGYADPSIFSRNFKRWYGSSPAEYVKLHRLRWKYRVDQNNSIVSNVE